MFKVTKKTCGFFVHLNITFNERQNYFNKTESITTLIMRSALNQNYDTPS